MYKEIRTFSNSINPKGNIIGQLEFEHAYYIVAVQHDHHNPMFNTTPSWN